MPTDSYSPKFQHLFPETMTTPDDPDAAGTGQAPAPADNVTMSTAQFDSLMANMAAVLTRRTAPPTTVTKGLMRLAYGPVVAMTTKV